EVAACNALLIRVHPSTGVLDPIAPPPVLRCSSPPHSARFPSKLLPERPSENRAALATRVGRSTRGGGEPWHVLEMPSVQAAAADPIPPGRAGDGCGRRGGRIGARRPDERKPSRPVR